MKKVIALSLSLFMIISACTKSEIRLQGYIANSNTVLISEVTIVIKKSKKTLVTKTDPVGFYMFENLTSGTWEMTVSKEGYVTQTKKKSLSEGSSGNIFFQNFLLLPALK
jgi:uncharacterized GH25 family protein